MRERCFLSRAGHSYCCYQGDEEQDGDEDKDILPTLVPYLVQSYQISCYNRLHFFFIAWQLLCLFNPPKLKNYQFVKPQRLVHYFNLSKKWTEM